VQQPRAGQREQTRSHEQWQFSEEKDTLAMSQGQPPGQPPFGAGPPGDQGPPAGGLPGNTHAPGSYTQNGPPPGRRALTVRHSGVITERNGVVVIVASFLTCGIYYLFWLYATTRELRDALEDDSIKPAQDVLLTIFSCFMWSIYVEYRNSQKVHAALLSRDPQVKDQSEMILILNLAALFVGMTWLIASYILQEDLNKLSRY
jgi:hypothetical protein